MPRSLQPQVFEGCRTNNNKEQQTDTRLLVQMEASQYWCPTDITRAVTSLRPTVTVLTEIQGGMNQPTPTLVCLTIETNRKVVSCD